jgi:hypothetical protein
MIGYLRRRLEERSTWVALGAAVAGAAALPSPYSWIAIGIGIIGTLLPSSGGGQTDAG